MGTRAVWSVPLSATLRRSLITIRLPPGHEIDLLCLAGSLSGHVDVHVNVRGPIVLETLPSLAFWKVVTQAGCLTDV